jgi:hypothetical protein
MTSITTLSQLGARLSLAKLHVKLLRNAAEGQSVQHAFYIVDPQNKKLMSFGEELAGFAQVRSKLTNDYTRFGVSGFPKYGGDFNYDYLLRACDIGDAFLTLHDDSLIYGREVFPMIRDSLSRHDFGGFLDQRAKDAYSRILLDGVPLGELRIGTWFLFGKTDIYRKNGYTMAIYKNFYRWLINLQFRTTRLSAKGFRLWLNGGFDLNICARLDGRSFDILDHHQGQRLGMELEHFEKITGFFAHRGMLPFVDTPDELDQWKKWMKSNAKLDKNGRNFEIDFMKDLAALLARHDIEDPLLNTQAIAYLEGKS